MLKVSDAPLLLQHDYLDIECGHGLTEDNMYHIAASTYMEGCSAEMIDWWFGYIHTTEQYKLWHPRDHVFSDWIGPRDNRSEYIGGHHIVKEYIGGQLGDLIISFTDPSTYFGPDWREQFDKAGYGTAVCARVGNWDFETKQPAYTGHLIHLIKNEPGACRMRSRFWMGDIEGLPACVGDKVPAHLKGGLMKHATEEMAILAAKLPELYARYSRKDAVNGQKNQ